VQLAGGLTPEADGTRAELTRIDESQRRVVLRVDLSPQGEKGRDVRNGDILRVDRLRPSLDGGVVVQGHVYTSGVFAYHDGLRLSDVIHSVDDLQPNADLHYVLIRRELPPDRRITILSADLVAALSAPGSKTDPTMMPRDRIMVFDLASGRDHDIQPWLEELRLQSSSNSPTPVVHVDGQVKVPGDYPLEAGMTVRDLVRAGGGLADAAYRGRAELTRYTVVDGETRRTELLDVDIADVLKGEPSANILLSPFDNLSIKEVPEWRGQESVELKGEVRFPGRYAIKRGETLRSVLARAGGLTQYAFPEGSVFTREELRRREQQQMDMLATRMQSDLTVLALQGAVATQLSNQQGGTPAALVVGQSLLTQLRAQRAVGRLVIDLPAILHYAPGSQTDVILRNGDQLIVPRVQQEVTVIGEVQTSTSHLYKADLTRDDYISLSGGMTRRGDAKRIYVVRANGSVVAAESGSRWFSQAGNGVRIKAGDTIVVPLDAEKYPALPFWQAVTSIIYNVAIAAAAVHSF
jgi:polysaccharide export outer membrane protein